MLLNYLFANFHEEQDFIRLAGISANDLENLIKKRIMPSAPYIFGSNARSVSFVSDVKEDRTYRFHLKGHLNWIKAIDRLNLDCEQRAREFFDARYAIAKKLFFSGQLGAELAACVPEVPSLFDAAQLEETWNHFLNGVYGVCTRDGQPETIFLKQSGVMFIERMTQAGPKALSPTQLNTLTRAVAFLDGVESDFAPHEVAQASRQRCIVDVRARFLCNQAA
ncbi:hypothetical protein HBA54_09100 [Pelagibius litoralis]|uniref:Uncharacterized protein n=1 Tax=Pelagibius litoralis TaxID=374515 RepID=A0A967C250_9PROT|nr:DUF6058 family natural product biosynthesis protein [Pelagibius litoralis]NIA68746.1 hypothetical protein [Pelagibius litoralis]